MLRGRHMFVNRAHAPARHTTGHDDNGISNAWFSFFCACMIVMGLDPEKRSAITNLKKELESDHETSVNFG